MRVHIVFVLYKIYSIYVFLINKICVKILLFFIRNATIFTYNIMQQFLLQTNIQIDVLSKSIREVRFYKDVNKVSII